MRETKVNLKHLLEDIRDSYSLSLEEVIVVELIANALDSKASKISFLIESERRTLTVVDNGRGMRRQELPGYHNIATTSKVKGEGIGFAGLGAKLSLLLAASVITETKGGYGTRCATGWYLKDETSAPWKFIPSPGNIPTSRGTAVVISLPDVSSPLFSDSFITETILSHYAPLFNPQLFQAILKHIYPKGVDFFVNTRKITPALLEPPEPKIFRIKLGRRLAGIGYLAKEPNLQKSSRRGLGVSTYGKVIKTGWEWIGLGLKEGGEIQGLVEIPALAEILTTNKMDFLKDATSLKKYYRYRKAIQEAITPILGELGQEADSQKQQKRFRALAHEIERALRHVLGSFPELGPLLGVRATRKKGPNFSLEDETPLVVVGSRQGEKKEARGEEEKGETESSSSSREAAETKAGTLVAKKKAKKASHRAPALTIGFEEKGEAEPLARMMENQVWVNTLHPAYLKAKKEEAEGYHVLFCVAWVLSNFLETGSSPQDFINDFLSSWGRSEKRTARLFKELGGGIKELKREALR